MKKLDAVKSGDRREYYLKYAEMIFRITPIDWTAFGTGFLLERGSPEWNSQTAKDGVFQD